MKKIFLGIAILSSLTAGAQKNELAGTHMHFSLGPQLALPLGIFKNIYSIGAGASAQGNFPVCRNVALTLNAGYFSYFLKKTYGGGTEGYIPLLGGAEINFSKFVFGSIQGGLTFSTLGGVGSAFTYSPGIGYKVSKNVSVLLKYIGKIKSAIASNAVGLRVSYTFGK